ncbi:MAG: hypothetical protein QOC93_3184 [Actinomycetota bacterium]|jgi:hypothetical protein|nr:hypothetical protein [Cryptosporangiaceae bacterium]MDQ1678040.1 hypothetical protein [Actinomycetota bacterium]
MSPRPWRVWVTVAVLVTVLGVYFVLLGERALVLLAAPQLVAKLLGAGLFVLPFIGAGLILAELRFGLAADRLATQLDDPEPDSVDGELPRRPSGRIDRTAAAAGYERRRAEVEKAPSDWRPWLRLGLAYDDAGDRRRARAAVRRAIELHRATGS